MLGSLALALIAGCAPPLDLEGLSSTSPATPSTDTSTATTDTATTTSDPDACAVAPGIEGLSEPFQPVLQDGDAVTLAHGPQGGWHIAVTAGIQGRSNMWLQPFVERVATGEQVAGDDNAYLMTLWEFEPATCSGNMQGMIAYLDDPPAVDQDYICGLVGEELILRLVATDPQSYAEAEVQVQVVAVADPADTCP